VDTPDSEDTEDTAVDTPDSEVTPDTPVDTPDSEVTPASDTLVVTTASVRLRPSPRLMLMLRLIPTTDTDTLDTLDTLA